MRLNYLCQFLLVFQLFYSFNSPAATCTNLHGYNLLREGEATRVASTEKAQLNEVVFPGTGTVYADPIEVEFWVEKCVDEDKVEYSLFGTVTPAVLGNSKGALVYDIAVIQNNQQFDGIVNFSDNLYVPGDFWAALQTIYIPSGSIISIPPGLELSQPFTLIFSCNNSWPYYNDCAAVNSPAFFDINPQIDNEVQTISSVNGTWFDPDYNGSGFNIVQTPAGFLIYFYGYKAGADGETLWLISAIRPKTIKKDETFTLDMYSGFIGNGGSLTTKPNTGNSGIRKWGTASITFNTCSSGEITLTKNDDISVTHSITLLAGVEGLTCID